MREILPGVHHWTAIHPKLGIEVSSYYLSPQRMLVDPLAPAEGVEWFADHGPPASIVLTNRHHWRDCDRFVEAYGIEVRASRPGMHEFADDAPVRPFDFGDELADGVVAHEVGVICPDESALHLRDVGALAVADGAINYGRVRFVSDDLLAAPEDVPAVKRGLRDAYRRLLDLEWDALLFAHGPPIVEGGKAALREFVSRDD